MYTHTPACVLARTAVINMKGARVLDQITQATDTRSENSNNRPPPNFFIGNKISNTGDYGPKAHMVGVG